MSAVIDNFLYMGSLNDVCTPSILNELKITHVLNLSLTKIILDQSFEVLHLPLRDTLDENLTNYIEQANEFIEKCHQQTNGRCLVFCKHGRSRSAAS
jgi:protein-tyrosine phosphatase